MVGVGVGGGGSCGWGADEGGHEATSAQAQRELERFLKHKTLLANPTTPSPQRITKFTVLSLSQKGLCHSLENRNIFMQVLGARESTVKQTSSLIDVNKTDNSVYLWK